MTDKKQKTAEAQRISDEQKVYWKKNVSIIRNLLIIWALVSYGAAIILANPFHEIPFFGITLSFWFAQQGSIVVFLVMIWYYAWRMDRLDSEYNVSEVKVTDMDKKGGISG